MKKIRLSIIMVSMLFLSCNRFPDLGGGYQLVFNGMHDLSIIKLLKEGDAPTILIKGHILNYAFDSNFIVVEERPRDSVPGIVKLNHKEYEKVFRTSNFQQYWIIDKNASCVLLLDTLSETLSYSNLYGPYNRFEFLQKCKELKIPFTLDKIEE